MERFVISFSLKEIRFFGRGRCAVGAFVTRVTDLHVIGRKYRRGNIAFRHRHFQNQNGVADIVPEDFSQN
jgi:hypothetical protein